MGSFQQSRQHHFLFPFVSLELWLEAKGSPCPVEATAGGCTPIQRPSPSALYSSTSAVVTLALGALPAWLYRLGFSLWSRSHGIGGTIRASGNGSRPNTSPGLILSPQEGTVWRQGSGWNAIFPCRALLKLCPSPPRVQQSGCGLTQLSIRE